MARAYNPRPLTPGVVTVWYRSPELLLGTKHYTPSVDLWSAGLVLAEMLLSAPCLTGETPLEQLSLIVKLLGKVISKYFSFAAWYQVPQTLSTISAAERVLRTIILICYQNFLRWNDF